MLVAPVITDDLSVKSKSIALLSIIEGVAAFGFYFLMSA
tara:strand:+ start:904 stop:1020 length:117 start_codon:yes stop_codon:yes gene_type:complete